MPISLHYHIQKQRKIKIELRIKLNHNRYFELSSFVVTREQRTRSRHLDSACVRIFAYDGLGRIFRPLSVTEENGRELK